MKKFLKFWLFPVLAIVMMCSVTACEDDDDEPDGKQGNYYIECTNVSGGGMNSQECNSFKDELNSSLRDIKLNGYSKDDAKLFFDVFIESLADELDELRPSTAIKISFSLKTEKGSTVKSKTITVNSSGAHVS